MLTPLLLATALAGPPERPVTLGVGLVGLVGPPSAGGVGTAFARFNIGKLGFEGEGGEGVASNDGREIGYILLDVRYIHRVGVYVRGGFHHHHEIAFQDWLRHPIGALAGSDHAIRHRSGARLGVGYDVTWAKAPIWDQLHGMVEACVSVFPDDSGPKVYVGLEISTAIDVGPKWAMPTSKTKKPPEPEQPTEGTGTPSPAP